MQLTFGSPSRVQELLVIPRGLSECVSIPDSVEILEYFGIVRWARSHADFEFQR
jgi:hypothetical protein